MMETEDCCQLCNEPRSAHGDKHHEFSTDGQLKGPVRDKTKPPLERSADSPMINHLSGLMLRTIERLTMLGVLQEADLAYIFGGKVPDVSGTGGQATGPTPRHGN